LYPEGRCALASALAPAAGAALSGRLPNPTVRASLGFVRQVPTEAAISSTAAATLAKWVLSAMRISKLTFLGAASLGGAIALCGARTYGWFGGLDGAHDSVRSAPNTAKRQSELTRAVDKLQSELDETDRPNAAMRKEFQDVRARLKTLRPAHELTLAQAAAARLAGEPSRSVARFADVLKRHPARPGPKEGDRLQLYMMDLVAGGTTLIADEPDPGLDWCATPKWSHHGTRIVFAAWSRARFRSSRIKAIEIRDGLPTCTDLGAGNSPTLSPDDKRIAFELDPGSEPGAESGVWVMQADGSDRRRVGEYLGAPFWSPDGREFLINDYSNGPTTSMVMNLETKEGGILQVAGHQIFSWPSWAGPGTLVSALATGEEGDSIALLDVRKPAEAKIIEVLWKRGDDLDVTPRWPIYQPETRRCIFIGVEPMKRTLFSFQRGETGRAKRLEPNGYNDWLGGLSFSPDGRYLLFCGNRPDRR
jgi:hypothetical protein